MAEGQSSMLLLESSFGRVYDVVCRAPRSGFGTLMLNEIVQIGLPRRGVFLLERRGEPSVIDTSSVVVLGSGDEYRVGHPTSDGDDGMVLSLAPGLIEDAIGIPKGRIGHLLPRDNLAMWIVHRALRGAATEQLGAEEALLHLLSVLSRALADTRGNRTPPGPGQRLRIEQARALLASEPTQRWNLGALGHALHCSPFHLARQFRVVTGETISRYVLRLRLGMALDRLANGERDIATLAVETGFTHHSHFSARFRNVFGMTPTQAREILTRRTFEEAWAVLAGTDSAARS
jgi:AraC-like DNA-binding protein